ncbi:hypothetical protein COV17_01465 [Candidatus Woesearchaeota archaeon CG10_big_fil_rev_8_21_14_0_10_36_11]|nr:MAG: hypothetical protein COV17_01465 [Candidatus Woesearchaeota archaeon CG10_big_fil_rev_8_21_14_0_10_36_11]
MDAVLVVIIAISLFLLIVYYVSRKFKQKTLADNEWQPFPERQTEPVNEQEPIQEQEHIFIPTQKKSLFLFIPIISPYLQRLKSKRHHKVRHQHHEEFFAEHGLAVPKPKNDIEKLQHVIHTHFNPSKHDTNEPFTTLRHNVRTTQHRKQQKQESSHKDTIAELHKIIHQK